MPNATELLRDPKIVGQQIFTPPFVEVGTTVVWRHSPSDTEPAAGLVVSVNGTALEVLIFPPGYHNGIPKSGCLHIKDPHLLKRSQEAQNQGCWDLTKRDKLIDELHSPAEKK